jgi:hypothetical protein
VFLKPGREAAVKFDWMKFVSCIELSKSPIHTSRGRPKLQFFYFHYLWVIFDVLKNLYIPKIYKLIQTKTVHRYRNIPFQEQNWNGLRNGIDKLGLFALSPGRGGWHRRRSQASDSRR